MGIKVAATLDDDFKSNYVVSTVAAAAFTIADGVLAIWIGNAHAMTKAEELEALDNCSKFIRENATETQTGANESYAEAGNVMLKDVNGAFDSAIDTTLTGTVTVTIGTAAVTGSGTAFSTELSVGDAIKIAGEIITILSIADDDNLVLSANHVAGAAGVAFSIVAVPEESKVGIWYGHDFQGVEGASISPFVTQLIEKYIETTQVSAG